VTSSQRAALHSGLERRSCAFQLVDGYTARGAGSPDVSGFNLAAYASVTGVPYEVNDSYGTFVETVHRGAFGGTLAKGPDVVFLTNHSGLPLGRTKAGTLQLNEDTQGLRYSVALDPDNPRAVELRSAVARRDVTESSFSFRVERQSWDRNYENRSIFAVSLDRGDVSAVTYGASSATGDDGNAATLRSQRAAPHAKFSGTHSHSHSAMGSQGGDRTHTHEHTHSGEAAHAHHDDGTANADVASASDDEPGSVESLSFDAWESEARWHIAELEYEARCLPPPLTPEQRSNIAEWQHEQDVKRWEAHIADLAARSS
jgi:HK97 family phage prohead protease